ncbi:MAG: HD domain-containing protein [Solirubrobacterales bacterium]|nr:HD domain-containing protein [Solirubrobacterales bacterium]
MVEGDAGKDASRIGAALARSEPVAIARQRLVGGSEDRAWIVGGALRDAARGMPITDVDLAIAGDAAQAARGIAGAAPAHAFELSDEFATWRVAARDGTWTLDVAGLRAPTIEEDLALRDLTVNAVAMPLSGGEPIDPFNGLADLDAGVLRAVSERSFADDPLRVLRAARQGAGLGLAPDDETLRLARGQAALAGTPAGERQFAELVAMLSGPLPLRALELLEMFGVTQTVLPELEALRGVGQSANHHLDAYGHTLEVLRRTLDVERDLDRYAGDAAEAVGRLLAEPLADGMTRRDGIRFAALLHDIGKPATRIEHDGWVSFRGHDSVGADMVRALCARFRTSRRFASTVASMTRDHLVLGFMVNERPLPPRRILDYLHRTGEHAVDTTLLTIADRLSAQGGGVPQEAIEGHLDLAREMLIAAVQRGRGAPEPLLRGDEIAAEAEIPPGPRLGEAVRELEAAQYAGEVGSRAEAVAHLREWQRGR